MVDFDQAIKLDPSHREAFVDRAYAYGYKGQISRAIEDYDRAIKRDPTFAAAFADRGLMYSRLPSLRSSSAGAPYI